MLEATKCPRRPSSPPPLRRRFGWAGLAALTLGACLAFHTAILRAAPAADPPGSRDASAPKAYVGLFQDNAVAVIDTAGRRVLRRIAVAPGPHGLAVTPDGRKVFVSSDGASVVSVIDTRTDSVTGTIEVGPKPHGLAMTPDGRTLLAAVFGADKVAVIDTKSDGVLASIPVASPHNIAVNPDGRTAWVASQPQNGPALVEVDIASRRVLARVPRSHAPRALSFAPDGQRLFFTEAGVDSVQTLDPGARKLVASIAVGASPHHPLLTANGEYGLVVSQGPGELTTWSPGSGRVIGRLPVGKLPHWIAASDDGDTAFVTNEGSGDVTIVDVEKQRVVGRIPVGRGPRKIVLVPSRSGRAARAVRRGKSAGLHTPQVRITGLSFDPPALRVRAGETVTWTNADSVPHVVEGAGGRFRSGEIAPGGSYRVALEEPGVYRYDCAIHPFMRAEVIVGR